MFCRRKARYQHKAHRDHLLKDDSLSSLDKVICFISADGILKYFPQKIGSIGGTSNKMSKPIIWENLKKNKQIINLSPAEFTQRMVKVNAQILLGL